MRICLRILWLKILKPFYCENVLFSVIFALIIFLVETLFCCNFQRDFFAKKLFCNLFSATFFLRTEKFCVKTENGQWLQRAENFGRFFAVARFRKVKLRCVFLFNFANRNKKILEFRNLLSDILSFDLTSKFFKTDWRKSCQNPSISGNILHDTLSKKSYLTSANKSQWLTKFCKKRSQRHPVTNTRILKLLVCFGLIFNWHYNIFFLQWNVIHPSKSNFTSRKSDRRRRKNLSHDLEVRKCQSSKSSWNFSSFGFLAGHSNCKWV